MVHFVRRYGFTAPGLGAFTSMAILVIERAARDWPADRSGNIACRRASNCTPAQQGVASGDAYPANAKRHMKWKNVNGT